MCPGVATTRSSTPAAVTTSPSAQRLRAQHQRRVERPHRRARQLREAPRAARVVVVAVGEQHQRHRAVRGDRAQVPLVVLAGVDHDAVGRRRARAAPRCWCRRGSSGTGCRPARPPACGVTGRSSSYSHETSPGSRTSTPSCRRNSGRTGSIVAVRRRRRARRRSRGTRRSRAAWCASGSISSSSPASQRSRASAGCHQRASTASVVCASASCASGSLRDEERRVVAPRRRRRRDPARPGPQEVGAQRALAEDVGEGGAARRRGRRARRRRRSTGPSPAEQHPALLVGLAHGGLDEGGRELGRVAEALAPRRRGRGRSSLARRGGRRGRRCRRGTRSSRPRTPSPRPCVGGTPAAGCGRAVGRGRRGSSTTVAAGFGTTGALVTPGR